MNKKMLSIQIRMISYSSTTLMQMKKISTRKGCMISGHLISEKSEIRLCTRNTLVPRIRLMRRIRRSEHGRKQEFHREKAIEPEVIL